MQAFNHIAGGFAFTGIFASFADINIFSQPEFIVATATFSVLPDIDHTKSLIGKMFFPLAKWINEKFGHRTITHSLIFYISVVALILIFEKHILGTLSITFISALALLSHIIFDMCTRSGVPFFYPFSSRRCVLPGNPNLRLSANNMKSEVIVFFVFVGLLLTCQPLMSQGFWTTYNKAFATFLHVHREFINSKDLIEIEYLINGEVQEKGILVNASDNNLVVFGDDFKELKRDKTSVVNMKHTGNKAVFQNFTFVGVSADSVKKIVSYPVISLELQANEDFYFYEGAIMKVGKTATVKYKKTFDFSIQEKDYSVQKLQIMKNEIAIEQEIKRYQSEVEYKNKIAGKLINITRN